MTTKPGSIIPIMRKALLKPARMTIAAVLLTVLALLVLLLLKAYLEGREIRAYVGGPYGAQLLYVQGCVPRATDGGIQRETVETLEEQFDSCRHLFGGRPGYYIYDFNIKRSVALSKEDMEELRKYAVYNFPESIVETVEKSQTNPFNTIIPLKDFPGFEHDCTLGEDGEEARCSLAPLKCDVTIEAIQCHVLNPNTGNFEHHLIKRGRGLEFLVPQGFVSGPDLFKLLKPRFFPINDRM